MYILLHSNVDSSCVSVWDKYPNKPTEKDLTETLSEYYDGDVLTNAVRDLLDDGECDIDKSDCPHFSLEEV